MSHIDEAWRRISGGAGSKPVHPDPFALDEYPDEAPVLSSMRVRARAREASAPSTMERPLTQPVRRGPASLPDALNDAASQASAPVAAPGRGGSVLVEPTLDAPPALLRQYRRLADMLQQARLDGRLKRILVTSPADEDGKAQSALHLALTMSKAHGTRGLLIDADLIKPAVHELVGVTNDIGLCNLLRDERAEIPLAQVTPLLRVLPAGQTGDDVVLDLASDRLRDLLSQIAPQYDWLMVVAPPVLSSASASALASLTEGVVLVVGASTPFPSVEKAIAEIGRPSIVGTVLHGLEGLLEPTPTKASA